MNTVFKLGYQAWLLLAIAAACALPWAGALAAAARVAGWAAVAAVLLLLGLVYPYAGNYARKRRLRAPRRRSTASAGCARARPATSAAIDWLRAHAPGDAVVLEAVGDGLLGVRPRAHLDLHRAGPTVLGWAGHELQWEHDPGTPRRRRERALHDHGRRPRRARCSTATASATWSSGRSSAPTTATPGSPSGTSSAGRCSTATARRSGDACRRSATARCV